MDLGTDADTDLGIPVPFSKSRDCGLDELEVVQKPLKDAGVQRRLFQIRRLRTSQKVILIRIITIAPILSPFRLHSA